jgi:hypothetical protein
LYALISRKAWFGNHENNLAITQIGLDAFMNMFSNQIVIHKAELEHNFITNEEYYEKLKDLINVVLLSIENAYLGEEGLLKNGKISSEDRGILHEKIWHLDVVMYLLSHGIEDVLIFPSYTNEDEPYIGKPELRRGFDIILKKSKTNLIQFIQLKSKNPKYPKKYHPAIKEVIERNFLDINPKRLARKISLYREYINSGFSEEYLDELNKYILESVPSTIGEFLVVEKDSVQYILENNHFYRQIEENAEKYQAYRRSQVEQSLQVRKAKRRKLEKARKRKGRR